MISWIHSVRRYDLQSVQLTCEFMGKMMPHRSMWSVGLYNANIMTRKPVHGIIWLLERLLITTTTMLSIKRNGQGPPGRDTGNTAHATKTGSSLRNPRVQSCIIHFVSHDGQTGTAGTAAGWKRKEAAPDVPDDTDGGRTDPGPAQYHHSNAHLYLTDVHQGEQSAGPAQSHASGKDTYWVPFLCKSGIGEINELLALCHCDLFITTYGLHGHKCQYRNCTITLHHITLHIALTLDSYRIHWRDKKSPSQSQ